MEPRSVARTIIIDGRKWLEIDMAKFRMPLDWTPESGMYLLVAPPAGGIGGFSALAKGDPGFSPSIELTSFLELAADDPTPASAALTLIAPATDVSGPVYGLDLAVHSGTAGEDGDAILDPDDYGTPVVGDMLVVASGGSSFELQAQKVGDMEWPASVTSVPGGTTAGYTMAQVAVPAYPFAWRPDVEGCATVAGSASDLRVDLVARLDADDGPVVGRCYGVAGQNDRLILISGPDSGAADSVNKVNAGDAAVIYFRTEKQSGTATYSALNNYARFSVKVVPVP